MVRRGRSATMGVLALAIGLLIGACGSEDDGSAALTPTTTTTSTISVPAGVVAVVLGPFEAAGGTDAQAAALLIAGCAALAPADRSGDSGALNDYFTDLFGGDMAGGGVRRDRREVDVALEQACARSSSDPEAFLAGVATTLALSPDDLVEAVGSACEGYRVRQSANADDPYAPDAPDPQLLAAFAAVGIDRAGVTQLIDSYCPVG